MRSRNNPPCQRDLDQVIALSALFQAADLVHRVSQGYPLPITSLEASVKSIFIFEPNSVGEIFPDRRLLSNGYHLLASALNRAPDDTKQTFQIESKVKSSQNDNNPIKQPSEPKRPEDNNENLYIPTGVAYTRQAIRYALGLLHLDYKIGKKSDIHSVIHSRLLQCQKQIHFSAPNGEVQTEQYTAFSTIETLAQIYLDTAGKQRYRIHVHGKAGPLKRPENAAKIRATLLAGYRAAILWRQVGGRRWHLLFKRRTILDCISYLQR